MIYLYPHCWGDLPPFYPVVYPKGSFDWNRETNTIEYVYEKERRSFPFQARALREEIADSLLLQFALLGAFHANVQRVGISGDELFRSPHLVSALQLCFTKVNTCYREETLFAMELIHPLPEALEAFQTLLDAALLHPCISVLGAHLCPPGTFDWEADPLLYRMDCPPPPAVLPKGVRTFATFLNGQQSLLQDAVILPCAGYPTADLQQQPLIHALLSQFPDVFYVEEPGKQISRGFYLFP